MSKKRILVCPLDWGLGHASRMIPLIKALVEKDFEVIVGADNFPLQLLQTEFPQLSFFRFPSFKIPFFKYIPLIISILLHIPFIFFHIIKEHYQLKKIIKQYNIDCVISDNRFGLYSKSTTCIYITHQIMIKMPPCLKVFEKIIYKIHSWFISNYTQCWIPDSAENQGLSGDLSHKYTLPQNAKFIGVLSKFIDSVSILTDEFKKYDILVILSGTEPQRTIFETKVIEQLQNTNHKVLIIKGKPSVFPIYEQKKNITQVSHLTTNELRIAILSIEIIISRSGYTTLMDLVVLNRKAILVPTPSQTEQEYLAKFCNQNGYFYCISEKEMNLERDIKVLQKLEPALLKFESTFLKNIDEYFK